MREALAGDANGRIVNICHDQAQAANCMRAQTQAAGIVVQRRRRCAPYRAARRQMSEPNERLAKAGRRAGVVPERRRRTLLASTNNRANAEAP